MADLTHSMACIIVRPTASTTRYIDPKSNTKPSKLQVPLDSSTHQHEQNNKHNPTEKRGSKDSEPHALKMRQATPYS